MILSLSKSALLVVSLLFILTPLAPVALKNLTGVIGVLVLLGSLPYLRGSYKRPTYIFGGLSLFIFVYYRLSFTDLINGVNSMLAVACIVAVLQLFAIPLKVGEYDRVLQKYLQTSFKKETHLYIFLQLITHVVGSFMLFGSIPLLYTIFYEPLKNMVHNPRRFLATAVGRGFSIVTLWAPGTVNVILVLEVTGAQWLQVLLPAVVLALLGLAVSAFLEHRLQLKGHLVQRDELSGAKSKENTGVAKKDRQKFRTLILIAVLLIGAIVLMEKMQILTSTTRVIFAGLMIVLVWTSAYRARPELPAGFREYWGNAMLIAIDTAALFVAMGIFAEGVSQAGLISYIQPVLLGGTEVLGRYSYFLIPPLVILLSLIGIHPFVSIMLVGNILVSVIQTPNYQIFVALSLLLGGVISFVLSPFAGNVLTLARMADCSPREVGYKWNGLFSISFLLAGYAFLFVLQMFY